MLASTAILNIIGLAVLWKLFDLLDATFKDMKSRVSLRTPLVENNIIKKRSCDGGTTKSSQTVEEKGSAESV